MRRVDDDTVLDGTDSPPAWLLSRTALPDLPDAVGPPDYGVERLRPGVVHIGVSGFHRGHQAVYLDRLARLDPSAGWSVTGVGLRGCTARAELLAQDCLWTVLQRDARREEVTVVGIHRDYLSAVEQPGAVMDALTDARTAVVTMTVTAPAYALPPRAGDAFELLALASEHRLRRGLAPLTVLSCDNLPRNGEATRRRVLEAARRRSPGLERYVERRMAFPDSMVDRITPPTTAADRRHLLRRYGVHDRAPVVTEAVSHWVVQDWFAGDRPELERVGVELVPDVAAHVALKTRLLNGAHLALGYLRRASRYTTTDRAMRDPDVRASVERMLADEVVPGLPATPGVDLAAYRSEVLGRIANPAVADPLTRLRRRGSVRMAGYLLPSLEAAVREGRPHAVLVSVVAGWVDHLASVAEAVQDGGLTLEDALDRLADPAAAALLPMARRARHDVRPFLAAAPGFAGLAADPTFTATLQRAVARTEVPGSATAS